MVVDMVEQELDQATQGALIAHLRQRAAAGGRPLFLMTRSSAILDLAAVGSESRSFSAPPITAPDLRRPLPGCHRLQRQSTCLTSPDVRARTQGVIAWRPAAA